MRGEEQTQKLKAGSSRTVVNFYQATEHTTSQNNEGTPH